jgi:GrpB-like predicted nucleotidyltransferase (UPF0157 family)
MIEAILQRDGPPEVGFPAPGALPVFDDVQPVIEPYDDPPPACRDFDPRAAEIARQAAGLISRHLPAVRAEHVGSTAVPGCCGRGIVDLLIACPEGDLENCGLLLGRLGFRQGGEVLFPPHPPPYRGVLVHNGDAFRLHVHVLPTAAAEVDSIRFLRSCLRADGELVRAYVQHKRAIVAGGASDDAEYCRQKAAFLKMVLG